MVGLRGGAGRATFQRHPRLKLSIHSNSYTDEECVCAGSQGTRCAQNVAVATIESKTIHAKSRGKQPLELEIRIAL